MREKTVVGRIDGRVGTRLDTRLYPNVCGVFRVMSDNGSVRTVRSGLKTGSADRIGIRSVLITPEMVGRYIGQFVSIEAKRPGGRIRPGQPEWAELIRAFGGVAAIVDNEQDAERALLEQARGVESAPDPRLFFRKMITTKRSASNGKKEKRSGSDSGSKTGGNSARK